MTLADRHSVLNHVDFGASWKGTSGIVLAADLDRSWECWISECSGLWFVVGRVSAAVHHGR